MRVKCDRCGTEVEGARPGEPCGTKVAGGGLCRGTLRAPRCSEQVWEPGGWHSHPCPNKAVAERDGSPYCGTHDPVAREKRAAARGPSKWQRELEAEQRRRANVGRLVRAAQAALAFLRNTTHASQPLAHEVAALEEALAPWGEGGGS